MGFRFRRALQIVPGVRLNLSRSGASVSLGARGLHYTIGARGTRASVGIPGSGLSWTSYQPFSSRSAVPASPASQNYTNEPPVDAGSTRSFESAGIEQLVAGSTNELAPILDAARKQFPSHLLVLAAAGLVVALASAYDLPPLAVGALVFGIIAWPMMFVLDRRRRTTTLEYNLEDDQNRKFANLVQAFNSLASCHRVWRVPLERDEGDWKRHAGASVTLERSPISLRMGLPTLVKSNLKFPSFELGKETIYFAPDSILIVARNSVAAIRYEDCEILAHTTRFVESDDAPSDTQIVGESWQFVNKKGDPDRRFNNNRMLPICLYGELDLKSASGLNARLLCSRPNAATEFATGVVSLRATNSEQPRSLEDRSSSPPIAPSSAGKDDAVDNTAAAFARESAYAQSLVLERGKLWEFLLVQELLASRLMSLKKECAALDKLGPLPTRRFSVPEFVKWFSEEMNAIALATSQFGKCIGQDLPNALGNPGVPGDAVQILASIDALFSTCRTIVKFEQELYTAETSETLGLLKGSLKGITKYYVDVLDDFAKKWALAIEGLRNGSQTFAVKAAFPAFLQTEKAVAELEKIRKNPTEYAFENIHLPLGPIAKS